MPPTMTSASDPIASCVIGGKVRSAINRDAGRLRGHCVVILVMISSVATCMAPVIPAE